MLALVSRLQTRRGLRCARWFSCSTRRGTKYDVLFLGRDEFSCSIFQALYGADDVWRSVQVFTNPEQSINRGAEHSVSPLKAVAQSLGVQVTEIPRSKADFRQWRPPASYLEATEPSNRIILTASFGRIIPAAALDHFDPVRRLNVHGSVLPKYRGPAPVQHAILNGDTETGVTVSTMLKPKEGVDTGEILASRRMALAENAETPQTLDSLATLGGHLLVKVLRDMQAGQANPIPQAGESSHAPFITAEDAAVNFKTMTAHEIVRRHRAVSHQRPLTAQTLDESTVQLHGVYVHRENPRQLPDEAGVAILWKPTKTVYIRCAEGTVLGVPEMKPKGKPVSFAREWWNGVVNKGVQDGKYQFP
ncbi:Formyltransferase [Cylindrobasidium torrendii FP15055 ss-10]|uniref:methionyl-tRNA formyltransferase n=1 Tax=Cylindrobasidium torrendii FP15055 ss-10 TaxID=1314674 RepID=A0A0D7BR51_9AGAR|nr:Formyltransferase [Cylindrobasidium torrendii FP15055 ss-10]